MVLLQNSKSRIALTPHMAKPMEAIAVVMTVAITVAMVMATEMAMTIAAAVQVPGNSNAASLE
jgi:hypothetical protein